MMFRGYGPWTFQRRSPDFSVRATSRRIVRVGPVNVPLTRWHTYNLGDGLEIRTLLTGRVKRIYS